ncbi:MAG: hypothetical protein J7L47_04470 [Candidatus Odinarchaeota archaeon]|nr:hypothetical protein [Candidatus Odinarchaeota archaeon]
MSVPNIPEVFKSKVETLAEKEKKGTRKKKFAEARRLFNGELERITNFIRRVLDDPHLDIEEELRRFLNDDIKAETE